jgi:hypothetical protein
MCLASITSELSAIAISAAALLFPNSFAFAQIIVDDAPLAQREILADVPVIGYRSFPEGAIIAINPSKDEWAIDGKIFYDAAANDKDLLMMSGKTPSDIQSLNLEQVLDLYKKYAQDDAFKCSRYGDVKVCKNKKLSTSPPITVKLNSQSPDAALDTQVV